MGFLDCIFGSPRPQFKYVVKNVLNETIAELPFRDLVGRDLRGKDFAHALFRWVIFDGCDLRDANFFGSDLSNAFFYHCDMFNACLAYARVDGTRFYHSNLDCIDLGGASGLKHASFDGAIITPGSIIPGRKIVYAKQAEGTRSTPSPSC
jgi:uncharacterized protein YjbI with pentapeptide repeats